MTQAIKSSLFIPPFPFDTPQLLEGLVLYAPLWEPTASGTTFYSWDNNHHLCTVTGAIWGATGRTFDAIDNKIVVPFTQSFPITVVAWVNPDVVVRANVIASYDAGGNEGWRLCTKTTTNLLQITLGGVANYDFANLVVPQGSWSLVACSISGNGGTATGYLNTTSQALSIGTMTGTPNQLVMGLGNTVYYDGVMGEVWLFNRVLTASELENIHQITKWRYS